MSKKLSANGKGIGKTKSKVKPARKNSTAPQPGKSAPITFLGYSIYEVNLLKTLARELKKEMAEQSKQQEKLSYLLDRILAS